MIRSAPDDPLSLRERVRVRGEIQNALIHPRTA
jgi:hypothetical protein